MIFKNKARDKCNTFFSCDFAWKYISGIILVTLGDPLGRKVRFKVKYDLTYTCCKLEDV